MKRGGLLYCSFLRGKTNTTESTTIYEEHFILESIDRFFDIKKDFGGSKNWKPDGGVQWKLMLRRKS